MARAYSSKQCSANFERGYEFSRLHEEWMAAVYALVVPGQQRHHRQPTLGGACEPGTPVQARRHHTERKAG
jgi:hypothetical protein